MPPYSGGGCPSTIRGVRGCTPLSPAHPSPRPATWPLLPAHGSLSGDPPVRREPPLIDGHRVYPWRSWQVRKTWERNVSLCKIMINVGKSPSKYGQTFAHISKFFDEGRGDKPNKIRTSNQPNIRLRHCRFWVQFYTFGIRRLLVSFGKCRDSNSIL